MSQFDFAEYGSDYGSCGMSNDGHALIVGAGDVQTAGGYPYNSYFATSLDLGATWTYHLTNQITTANGGDTRIHACNVTP